MNKAEKKADALIALRDSFGIISEAAKRVGISRQTLAKWIAEDKEFGAAANEYIERKKDLIENALLKKVVEGDTAAIIFAAKTQLRGRGYSEKASSTPTGGSATRKSATNSRINSWLSYMLASSADNAFVWGTTRSGKTYSILQWLVEEVDCGAISGQVLVAGQTSPFLRNGAGQYLRKIAQDYPSYEVVNNGLTLRHSNGSQILCQSFEDESRALSAQWAAVYLNEGNYITREVVDALRVRCNGLMICDYNPSVSDWWGVERQKSENSLFCRFSENKFLNDVQLRAIEEIKERGEFAPAGSYANWYYRVYYLGEYAKMGGGVFTNVRKGDQEEMAACEAVQAWGIDFGDVEDPNALVRVKVDGLNNRLYVCCELYRTAVDDIELTQLLNGLGVDRLVFETATGGQTRAKNFKKLGFKGWVVPCEKERVAQSVFNLVNYEIVCLDEHSYAEFHGYRIESGRFCGADHIIDATRYAAHKLITGQIY